MGLNKNSILRASILLIPLLVGFVGDAIGAHAATPSAAPPAGSDDVTMVSPRMSKPSLDLLHPVAMDEAVSRRPFYLELIGVTSLQLLRAKGFGASLGYQGQYLGVDLAYQRGSGPWGVFSVVQDDGGTDSSPWAPVEDDDGNAVYPTGLERYRYRPETISFGFSVYELGVSVSGKIFTSSLPKLRARSRFGMALGSMSDEENVLNFSMKSWSYQAGLGWALDPKASLSFWVDGTYRTGLIYSQSSPSAARGRLPIGWVGLATSLRIAF